MLGIAGIAGVVTSITANTRLQLLTPNHLRGRVMGIYVLLMGGTTPVGSFILGEVAGHLGTGVALVVFGAATAGGVGLIATLRRHASSRAGDAEAQESSSGTTIGAC
ncbi:MAG: MFS transporter [Acidimicrobiales bacterium]